jgi:hypothetical protein
LKKETKETVGFYLVVILLISIGFGVLGWVIVRSEASRNSECRLSSLYRKSTHNDSFLYFYESRHGVKEIEIFDGEELSRMVGNMTMYYGYLGDPMNGAGRGYFFIVDDVYSWDYSIVYYWNCDDW